MNSLLVVCILLHWTNVYCQSSGELLSKLTNCIYNILHIIYSITVYSISIKLYSLPFRLSVIPIPSSSLPSSLSTSSPSHSNLVSDQWNDTSNSTNHDVHSACCEPEIMLVITLSTAFGFLLSLLILLICCTLLLVRRAKQHHTGCVMQTNHQSTGRALPCMLSLHSNSYSGDSSLMEQSDNKGDSRQQPLSPYKITPNPSYSSTTAFLGSRPRSPDVQSEHQYDDIINFPRKDEDASEIYDRLEPTLASLDIHTYENSALNMLQQQCSVCTSTSPATVSTVSTSPSSCKGFDQSPTYEEHYVNEHDGPLPPNLRSKLPFATFCTPKTYTVSSSKVHWKRQCRTLARHYRPRDYEVPINRNHTFKW